MSKVLAETISHEAAAEGLRSRRREREALLARIGDLLKADERIAAAWTFGSVGRGDADDLSDLDVRVAVADDHIQTICQDRRKYVVQFGKLLLTAEAPQNAPPGGAFLLALYDGEYGPQEVDWSWLPVSTAQTWPDVRILFDRAGLPRLSEPLVFEYQPVPEITPLEAAERSVHGFWGMMMVLGKYLARSPYEERMGLLWLLTNSLRDAQSFLGRDLSPKFEEMPDHPTPAEKITILRDLASQMELLMPLLTAAGANMPYSVVPNMTRYLDLLEAVALNIPPA